MGYEHNPILKMYARSGLRTAADWASFDREVEAGQEPRITTMERGRSYAFYGRDQTAIRVRVRNPATAAPPTVTAGAEVAETELAETASEGKAEQ